jgi:hypothetical protein
VRIKAKYVDRCKNYVRWLGNSLFMPDESLYGTGESGGVSAVEAMHEFETHGRSVECREPYILDCLKCGKQCREFLIKGWLSMTRAGEAVPEEFYGCAGLRSTEEFRSIFGRLPILQHLLSTRAALALTIHSYERLLSK